MSSVSAGSQQIRRYLYRRAAADRSPIGGTFELTPRCNMHCKMCYIRMSAGEARLRGRELSREQWLELGKTCAENGMLFLLLTGGEPFLRQDFREIYTGLKELGLFITINTNATLIGDKEVAWLKANAPVKINVTLYGAGNETYARLCGHPTGYDAATAAILKLKAAGLSVSINCSLTRYNRQEMNAIVRFAGDHNLPINAASYMFPPVRSAAEGVPNEAVRFSPEEAGIARAEFECANLPPELLELRLDALHRGCPLPELADEEHDRTPGEKLGCTAGKASFWITWDGRMLPCGMMEQPCTLPLSQGFSRAWKELCRQVEELRLPAECTDCKMRSACTVCGAVSMAESGGRCETKPDYLCRMTGSYIQEMQRQYRRRCHDNP